MPRRTGHGRSVCPAERRDPGRGARSPVHLPDLPVTREQAVVDGPAPAPRRVLLASRAKGRRPIEAAMEVAPGAESLVDGFHALAPEDVPAATAFVEDGRVIEERLDEVELL